VHALPGRLRVSGERGAVQRYLRGVRGWALCAAGRRAVHTVPGGVLFDRGSISVVHAVRRGLRVCRRRRDSREHLLNLRRRHLCRGCRTVSVPLLPRRPLRRRRGPHFVHAVPGRHLLGRRGCELRRDLH
jgi:hypothetical protein